MRIALLIVVFFCFKFSFSQGIFVDQNIDFIKKSYKDDNKLIQLKKSENNKYTLIIYSDDMVTIVHGLVNDICVMTAYKTSSNIFHNSLINRCNAYYKKKSANFWIDELTSDKPINVKLFEPNILVWYNDKGEEVLDYLNN